MKKVRAVFYECEHRGDEQHFVDNLYKHPQISNIVAEQRPYEREYGEECVVLTMIVTGQPLTSQQIQDIGWGPLN